MNIIRVALSRKFDYIPSQAKIINKKNGREYDYNDVDTKIMVYEDSRKSWFFNIAKKLKKDNEAGFVILMISVSYLEGNQQFRNGEKTKEGEVTATIKTALERIFPELDDTQIGIFIKGVRHGFFHDGITRKDILMTCDIPTVFKQFNNMLIINPHLFLDRVKKDFEAYIKLIKSKRNTEDRRKFEQFWNFFKGT